MTRKLRLSAAVGAGLLALAIAHAAAAQKQGGILRSYSIDSPASMSIHEEATVFAVRPAMGVFNNLVMYDQQVKQNSMQSMQSDQQKRKELVWEIERKLAEDGPRPMIFYAPAANCHYSYVKGLTIMANSIYNGWRMEDVWLDK